MFGALLNSLKSETTNYFLKTILVLSVSLQERTYSDPQTFRTSNLYLTIDTAETCD